MVAGVTSVEGGREGGPGGGSYDYFHREGIWTCVLYRAEGAEGRGGLICGVLV